MKKIFTIIIFTTHFLSAFIFGKNALAQNVTCTEGTRTGACRKGTSDCTPADYDFIPDLIQCGIPYNGCCILKQAATPPAATPPAATPPAATPPSGQTGAGGAAAGSSGANTTPVRAPGGTGAATVNLVGIQKSIVGTASKTTPADVAKFIGKIIQSILSVIGAFALLLVVFGGLSILTSHGNPEGISKGKKTITWAIVGVGVILGSYALVSYVISGIGGGGYTPAATTPGSSQTAACTAISGNCYAISPCNPEPGTTVTDIAACSKYLTDSGIYALCDVTLCDADQGQACCTLPSAPSGGVPSAPGSCVNTDGTCNESCCTRSCIAGETIRISYPCINQALDCCAPIITGPAQTPQQDAHGCYTPTTPISGCVAGYLRNRPTTWSCCDCGTKPGTEGMTCKSRKPAAAGAEYDCGKGLIYCKR